MGFQKGRFYPQLAPRIWSPGCRPDAHAPLYFRFIFEFLFTDLFINGEVDFWEVDPDYTQPDFTWEGDGDSTIGPVHLIFNEYVPDSKLNFAVDLLFNFSGQEVLMHGESLVPAPVAWATHLRDMFTGPPLLSTFPNPFTSFSNEAIPYTWSEVPDDKLPWERPTNHIP